MRSAIARLSALRMPRPACALAWSLALFITTHPLYDSDLYWHLANGRATTASRRIINEEIFSYTHFGEHFVNHEWLSQVLFFLAWDTHGPAGLFILKALLVSLTVCLVFHTATRTGGSRRLAALLSVLAVLAGLHRYSLRPELFSLLNMAALGFILHGFRARRISARLLWFVPVICLVWDWLHGAVFGLVFLAVFTGAENLKSVFPALRRERGPTGGRLRHLNICCALTAAVTILNPYGLRTYEHFRILAAGSSGADTIVELQPMWQAPLDHVPFLLMVLWALSALAVGVRRLDVTDLALALTFGLGAMRYNRLAGVAAIVLVPIIAGQAARQSGRIARRLHLAGATVAVLVLVVVGYQEKIGGMAATSSAQGTYLLPSFTAFGLTVNELYTPAGSVRFIRDHGLQGNMYNNGNFGGYLAYYLAPERKIFQYNMPPIFGDPTRFARDPHSLDRWQVDYALAATNEELTRLFPRTQWAWVYSDYVSTLVVKRTDRNRKLIDAYEIRYFTPEISRDDFEVLALDPNVRPRLAFEMGVYLAYMNDGRLAARWARMLADYPSLTRREDIRQLLRKAGGLNPSLAVVNTGS